MSHGPPRTSQRAGQVIVVVVVLAILLAVAAWMGFDRFRPSVDYAFCATFSALPETDSELIVSLQAERNVVPASVAVTREGNALRVAFTMTKRISEPVPDLDARCAEIGYAGQSEPFRSCE
ncbi:MAG: hypothetical protein JNM94_16665 [Phycisphaerae bacterium]|nr:hypothetical protein [Phycisphaerae bacterium]